MLTPKVELSIWKDDLTRHAVDAVVNAANEELLHGGGLAQALVKAGGFEIQEESRALISKYGRIPTGEIVITGAGKLPCRKIIHAVGPRWSMMDSQECIVKLKRAIVNILCFVSGKISMNSSNSSPELWDFTVPSESVYRDHCANYQNLFPKHANCQ